MRIDVATLFPEMCEAVVNSSIIGRGIKNGYIEVYFHNIRDYSDDKHRRVDDKPYGGGYGMVMQAEPVYKCICALLTYHEQQTEIFYLSPQGKTLTQDKCKELSKRSGFILLCGHYEGIDQRVLDLLNVTEISIGDYVLTGGELPALVLIDAVCRLVDGVLPSPLAYEEESHFNGLLEHSQYTRPEQWHGLQVPEVLLSGHHKNIDKWKNAQSLEQTEKKRPDILNKKLRK